jgi:hypothetical protein
MAGVSKDGQGDRAKGAHPPLEGLPDAHISKVARSVIAGPVAAQGDWAKGVSLPLTGRVAAKRRRRVTFC